MHFDVIICFVLHFWQEACLVLGASCQRLGGNITKFKSASWVSWQQQNDITTSSYYGLTWIVYRRDITVILHSQKSILNLMIKLRSYTCFLNLHHVEFNISRVMLWVLPSNRGEVNFHGHDYLFIKQAPWLHHKLSLQQIPQLLDASLKINITLKVSFIFHHQLSCGFLFGCASISW